MENSSGFLGLGRTPIGGVGEVSNYYYFLLCLFLFGSNHEAADSFARDLPRNDIIDMARESGRCRGLG